MQEIIVTGAGAGIGRATALAFAARRWRAICCDIDGAAAAATAAQAGGDAIAVTADITDEGAIARLIAAPRTGRLGAVIHCAALFPRVPLPDTSIADFDRVMAVNLRAAVELTLHARTAMPRGGALVFLTSGSGLLAAVADPFQRGFALYGASKAALDRWVAGVAAELAPSGIFATTLTPGAFVETPGLARTGIAPPAGAATIPAERVAEAIVRIVEDRTGQFSGARLSAAEFGTGWR